MVTKFSDYEGLAVRDPDPRPRGPTAAEVEQIRAWQWQTYVDGRIAAAFAARDAIRLEAMGQVIAAERQRHRAEIAGLRAELEPRLDALELELTKQGDFADAQVIDLPLTLRKRDAAA